MASDATAPSIVRLTTPLGVDVLRLHQFSGREAISELFRFELDLIASVDRQIPFEQVVGAAVSVEWSGPDQPRRHVHGIVRRFCERHCDERFVHFRAEVVPFVWRLTRTCRSRIFQHKTVVEILQAVLAGFPATFRLRSDYLPHNYCVQYQESDFAFISRLMEEEGLYYYFEHSADGHQLIIADASLESRELPEAAVIRFDAVAGETQREWRIDRWEKSQEIRAGRVVAWDDCFQLPSRKLRAEHQQPDDIAVGAVTHSVRWDNSNGAISAHSAKVAQRFDEIGAGGNSQPEQLSLLLEETQRIARICGEQQAVGSVQIDGSSDCFAMLPGFRFALRGHRHGDGDYLLLSVDHHLKVPLPVAEATDGTAGYRNRFTAVPLALPYHTPRGTPAPIISGPQTATVEGPEGEEIHTDRYGRIKVRFHWDSSESSGMDASCWVRVAQSWAGSNFGSLQIPRVGQEVVVEFIDGDPDAPIVTGSVYNAVQMPPQSLPANRNVSGLISRSVGGDGANASQFTIDDTSGKERVHVHSEKDLLVGVENDHSEYVAGNRLLYVGFGSGPSDSGSSSSDGSSSVASNHVEAHALVHWGEYLAGAHTEVIAGINAEVVGGLNANVTVGGKFDYFLGPIHATVGIGLDLGLTLGSKIHFVYPTETRIGGSSTTICLTSIENTALTDFENFALGSMKLIAGASLALGSMGNMELVATVIESASTASTSISSKGTMDLSSGAMTTIKAGGRLFMDAPDATLVGAQLVTIAAPGGSVLMRGVDMIYLESMGEIIISVGNSFISMSPTEMNIFAPVLNLGAMESIKMSAPVIHHFANSMPAIPSQPLIVPPPPAPPPEPPPPPPALAFPALPTIEPYNPKMNLAPGERTGPGINKL